MAKVVAPENSFEQLPMFINIDSAVGHNAANSNQEDIMLVQFMLKKVAEKAPPSNDKAKKTHAIMKQVAISGRIDATTIDAITEFQESMRRKLGRSVIVDGRVSRARGYYYSGATFYTIVSLNGYMRRHYPQKWPRLQDFPDCPPPTAPSAQSHHLIIKTISRSTAANQI